MNRRVSALRLALAPLAATVVARAAVLGLLPVAPRWDGFFYARLATRLAAGAGYVDGPGGRAPEPTAFYPVGYPAALSVPLRLGASMGVSVALVNLLAAALGTLAAVFLARAMGDDRSAVRAGWVHALLPGPVLWATAAMTETLTAGLTWCSVALGVALAAPRARTIAAGVLLGLATLTRPPSLLTGLGALGLAVSPRRRAAVMAVLALGCSLALAPWTLRNCRVLDRCALVSTNGGSNLLIGTFSEARGGYRRPTVDDGCGRARGEVDRDRCQSRVAVGRIADDPARWLLNDAWKLLVTFGWEHDPVSYVSPWNRGERLPAAVVAGVALCTLSWWGLVVAAAFGYRRVARGGSLEARGAGRWVAWSALSVVATHAVFLGADRYHLVLAPGLSALAGVYLGSREGSPA